MALRSGSLRTPALFLMVAGAVLALFAPLRSQPAAPTVWIVPVTGVIELGLAPFIERSLREAEAAGAAALILDIDTPGGRVDAAQRITDALQDASIPTYAFVNRRALSAGAMISLAADRIYMRPGSTIGAATPIVGDQKASEKIVSAMRSEMRALAEARGLDPRVAEAMVDEEIGLAGVVEEGKLLTLTTEEAAELGYAVAVEDLDALLLDAGLEGAEQVGATVNWAERVVRFLTHPLVAPFLLSIGFLGLVVEVKSPGFGVAGLVGAGALALFFGSHLIIGLAGWGSLLLFGAGVILLLIELVAFPGFGLLGIAGIIAITVGLFRSMLGTLPTLTDFSRSGAVLSSSLFLALIVAWFMLRQIPASGRLVRSGVMLTSSTSREGGYSSATVRHDLVGREGVALTDLHPSGSVLLGDERLDVVADGGWIAEGTPVRVILSEGYRHVVRAAGRAPAVGGDPQGPGDPHSSE
jgi:membrane-bound serine protease (ClpP class)